MVVLGHGLKMWLRLLRHFEPLVQTFRPFSGLVAYIRQSVTCKINNGQWTLLGTTPSCQPH